MMRWKAHLRDVTSLALAPDLSSIISYGVDGHVYQWKVETGELLNTIREPIRPSRGGKIAYNPSGSKLGVSWTYSLNEGHLEVYDVESWTLEYVVQSQEIFDFAWSPSGEHLAIASGGIRIIDSANGKIVPTPYLGHDSWTHCVAFTPDGKKMVSGGDIYDSSLALWDAATFENLAKEYSEDESAYVFTPFEILHILDNEVIVNDAYCAIKWNFDTGFIREIFRFPRVNQEHTWANISADGRMLAYTAIHDYVDIPNWLEPSIYRSERWARARKATGATVNVENLSVRQTLHNFEGYTDEVRSLIFTPDSTRLFTGDWDGYVTAWEL